MYSIIVDDFWGNLAMCIKSLAGQPYAFVYDLGENSSQVREREGGRSGIHCLLLSCRLAGEHGQDYCCSGQNTPPVTSFSFRKELFTNSSRRQQGMLNPSKNVYQGLNMACCWLELLTTKVPFARSKKRRN